MKYFLIINSAEAGGAQSLLCNWKSKSRDSEKIFLIVLQSEGFFSGAYSEIFDEVFYLNISFNPYRLLRGISNLLRLVKHHKPKIIHTHLLQSDLIGLFLTFHGCRVITSIHSASYSAEKHKRSIYIQKIVARNSNRFTRIIATSNASRIHALTLGYQADKLILVKNGTHESQDISKNENSGKYFLSLARWHPVKDHETLLKGFHVHISHYPESKLHLAGFGINQENMDLMKLINDLKLNNSVIVHNTPQNSRELIQKSLAVIISSISESVSMVAIESLSEAIPVITTKSGDYESVLVNSNLLFDVGDFRQLAKCMDYLCNSDGFPVLRQTALEIYNKEFTSKKWVQRHLEIYMDSFDL